MFIVVFIVVTIVLGLLWWWDARPASGESVFKKKSPIIQFEDSGWILLYVFCGWLCILLGVTIIVIVLKADNLSAESATLIFIAFLSSLSLFFAAHVLRLQEKTAHHAEKNSELLEIIVDQTKKIGGGRTPAEGNDDLAV